MLFNTPINRYRPFIPIDGNNNVRTEIGEIQRKLVRWSKVSDYWGPRVWYYIHNTAATYVRIGAYTEKQTNALYEWLREIPRILPCRKCRYWYRKYVLNKLDLRKICSDPITFFDTMIDIHNRVNTKLNKEIIQKNIVYTYFNIHI
jgi:hypothetical protein